MLCRNLAKINTIGNETQIKDSFNDVLDDKNYLVIDKELFARSIMDKENVKDLEEMDLITIVNNSFEEFTQDIVELIIEMRCYE